MVITQVVEYLLKVKDIEGNIEVTGTGSTLPDDHGGPIPDVFETTIENFEVGTHKTIGKRVRMLM